MSNHSDLVGLIGELFERQRARSIEATTTAGFGPTISTSVAIVTPEGETGARGESVTRELNPMSVWGPLRAIQGCLQFHDSSELANVLYTTFGNKCSHWSPFVQPQFQVDPVGWITSALLTPLAFEYLTRLKALDQSEPELTRELADGLIRLVEGDAVDFVTFLPLAGLRLMDAARVGPVTVRPLTPEELGELAVGVSTLDGSRLSRIRPIWHFLDIPSERCALVVRTPCPKNRQPESRRFPERVVLALQLLGFEPHGRGRAISWTEPSPTLSSGGQQFRLPSNGTTKEIVSADIESALRLAERIPVEVFDQPRNPPAISLHRFMLGAADGSHSDALIDFTISLEALLLPETRDELRFRFALHGALFATDLVDERHRVFEELRKVYDIRSRLVHGSAPPDGTELRATCEQARRLAQQLLVKALEQGWPVRETYTALIMN